MEGWISIHRALSDNPLWTCESFSRGQAWVDIILLSNHKDAYFYKRGIKIEVKRGQLAWSELALSERWKWSRNKVRKFLKDLEKEHQILISKTNVTQLVTVVNYDKYQSKGQQTEHQKDTKRTPNDTTDGHQKDTNNNDNNENPVKNVKNENNLLTEVKTSDVPLEQVEYYQIALNIQKKIRETLLEGGSSTAQIDKAKYKTWVDPIRLMMTADGITREQINKAARFGFDDDFWKKTILSTSNFRKHFNRIILDSNGKQKNGSITERFSKEYLSKLAADVGAV